MISLLAHATSRYCRPLESPDTYSKLRCKWASAGIQIWVKHSVMGSEMELPFCQFHRFNRSDP